MTIDRHYKTAIQMAWPAVLESFFVSLAGVIDTIMVGTLGDYAISAVGLTTQPKFIGLTIFLAINIAVSSLVARRRGQEDKHGANQVFTTAMTLVLIFCLIVTVISVALAPQIMSLVGSQPDTHDQGVLYFRIIMGGMVFNVVAMCINAAQRGSGKTRIAFVANVISSIVNVIFNYLLIGGKFGFPALGIQGAAIATVLGTIVAMVLSVISLFHDSSLIDFRYIKEHKLIFDAKVAKSIMSLGGNLAVENVMMRVGFLATAISAAGLGTEAFAVHTAGMSILSLGFSFGNGMQVAAVALSGRSLGQENKELAIRYGHICQRIGFIMSLILSTFLFIFRRQIMGIYLDSPTAIKAGEIVIYFIMVIVIFQVSQIIYSGCLRSGGDVRYTLIVGIISVTVIRTAITLILVNAFGLGLVGIWVGILSDQLTRFILLRHRFQQGNWVDIRI